MWQPLGSHEIRPSNTPDLHNLLGCQWCVWAWQQEFNHYCDTLVSQELHLPQRESLLPFSGPCCNLKPSLPVISTSSSGDQGCRGVCCSEWGGLPVRTFPCTSTSCCGEASPTAPPDVVNNEPAVQRGVREVGPGPGGHLFMHGESKNNHQKHLVIFHSAISCQKRRRSLKRNAEKWFIFHVCCPQNHMQECAATVHRLNINGQRLLVSSNGCFRFVPLTYHWSWSMKRCCFMSTWMSKHWVVNLCWQCGTQKEDVVKFIGINNHHGLRG